MRIELRQIRKELMAIKRSVEIIESRMMEGQREERRGEERRECRGCTWLSEEERGREHNRRECCVRSESG